MRKYIALLLLFTNGCSWLTMTPPISYEPIPGSKVCGISQSYYGFGGGYSCHTEKKEIPNPKCTDDNAAPIGDAILSSLFGASSIVSLGFSLNESANTYGPTISTKEVALYSLTAGLFSVGIIFLASSISGIHRSNHCYEIKATVEAKNKELENQEKQRQAEENARQEELKLEQERREQERLAEEKRRQEEEWRQQEEAKRAKEIIKAYCKGTLWMRTDNAKKLNAIIGIENWITDNCKQVPVVKMVEKIDVKTGEIVKAPIQVGITTFCSHQNRPDKLDGTKLTDNDILNKRYEPSYSDMTTWRRDVDDTNGKCKEFD